MKKLKDIWFAITNPSYWIQIYEYSEDWDIKLNALLDKNHFTDFKEYTARLGAYTLWVENQPNACMEPYEFTLFGGSSKIRAKRRTIYRAIQKFRRDRANAIEINSRKTEFEV